MWEWLSPDDKVIYSSVDDFHRWKKFYTLPLKEFEVAIKKEKHDLTKKEIEEHIEYIKQLEFEEKRINEMQEEAKKLNDEYEAYKLTDEYKKDMEKLKKEREKENEE